MCRYLTCLGPARSDIELYEEVQHQISPSQQPVEGVPMAVEVFEGEPAGEAVRRVVVVGAFAEGGECVVGTCGRSEGSVRLARTAGLSLS